MNGTVTHSDRGDGNSAGAGVRRAVREPTNRDTEPDSGVRRIIGECPDDLALALEHLGRARLEDLDRRSGRL